MPTLSVWLHNIDPFAIHIAGNFGLRWYGLAYLTGFVVCWLFCQRIRKVGITTLHQREITDFVIAGAIAVVGGGRIGYVIFYKPHLLIEFSGSLPFWGLFDLQGGGMSSHGGMIGTALVIWWYARRRRKLTITRPAAFDAGGKLRDHVPCAKCNYDLHKVRQESTCPECGTPVSESLAHGVNETIERRHSFLHLFDITALAATVGFFFGRIANFINGESVGHTCDESLAWAVKFPQDMHEWIARWDTEKLLGIQAAAARVGITAQQWLTAIDQHDAVLVNQTVNRLIGEIQAGGTNAAIIGDTISPLLLPHHPSQLYAAFLEGFLVFWILTLVWLRPRKPGVICALFGVAYGIARIINEFWRAPDAHIKNQEFDAIGVTRGQLLSIVMVLIGAAVMVWAARRDTPKMGGLMPVKDTLPHAAA